MIEEIDRLTSFDAENIQALRARIDTLKLKTPRRAKPKAQAAAHQSDLDGWKYVRSWASQRPSAWENEDRRKKKGSAHQVPELPRSSLELSPGIRPAIHTIPGRPKSTARFGAFASMIFPDELMYGLIIRDETSAIFTIGRRPGNARAMPNENLNYLPMALSAALLRCSAVAHSGGKSLTLLILASSFR